MEKAKIQIRYTTATRPFHRLLLATMQVLDTVTALQT